MNGFARALCLLLISTLWTACVTPAGKLAVLEVGMTEQEVRKVFSNPDAVRLGGISRTGTEAIEVWEFHLYDRGKDTGLSSLVGLGSPNVDYWLYFEDGLLYRWTRAGEQPVLPVK
ncbi:MAG: hypothetical protein V3T14_10885 [Myxococcota bacterium]